MDDPDEICGTVMSQGVTFCAAMKCRVKHRTSNSITRVTISPGELYVLKVRNVAFLTPRIFTDKVEDEVLEKWLTQSQTLQSWSRIFRLCVTVNENAIATSENLKEENKTQNKTRNYKTPKKPKLEGILKSYSPPSYESFIPKNEDETSEEKAASVLQHIDNAFKGLHETVRKLNSHNKD